MIVKLYKPNAKNTGCAFSFDIGIGAKKSFEPCVYLRAVKQHSWDAVKKNGSFKNNSKDPEKSTSVKLNEFEVGGLINAIENYTEFSAYHSFEDTKTQISFKPWTKNNGTKAFSFGVVRNSTLKLGIAVEMSEAFALLEFLKFFLKELYLYRFEKNQEIRKG